jgi:hypothetical protein
MDLPFKMFLEAMERGYDDRSYARNPTHLGSGFREWFAGYGFLRKRYPLLHHAYYANTRHT